MRYLSGLARAGLLELALSPATWASDLRGATGEWAAGGRRRRGPRWGYGPERLGGAVPEEPDSDLPEEARRILAQQEQDRACFGLTEKLIEVSLF